MQDWARVGKIPWYHCGDSRQIDGSQTGLLWEEFHDFVAVTASYLCASQWRASPSHELTAYILHCMYFSHLPHFSAVPLYIFAQFLSPSPFSLSRPFSFILSPRFFSFFSFTLHIVLYLYTSYTTSITYSVYESDNLSLIITDKAVMTVYSRESSLPWYNSDMLCEAAALIVQVKRAMSNEQARSQRCNVSKDPGPWDPEACCLPLLAILAISIKYQSFSHSHLPKVKSSYFSRFSLRLRKWLNS